MTTTLEPAPSRQAWAAEPPGPVGARPSLVLAAIWLGAGSVLGLWWRDTTAISGLADWLTGAGRIAGLLAGYAIVVLLALMARVPALERGVGTDRLARWHASGGRYVVGLVVPHGVLITWGYAVQAHTGVLSQGASMVTSYPDVLAATVGGLLLVGVGIVSARAARRRMRYEVWHALHFFTYLATALAFSHQLSTGADFVANRPARIAWSALYAGVAGLLLWHRFLVPIRQALRHRLRVAGVRPEAPGVVSLYLRGEHLDELQAEPGQFFRWRFAVPGLWWAANPYSLSAPVHQDLMRITVKDLGEHSRAVARVVPGTRVFAEGPYGALTARRRRRRRVLLIAGGVGITPLRALFETIQATPGELTLVYRASSLADVAFRSELDRGAALRGARVHYLIGSRAELGHDPLSADNLAGLVPGLAEHDVFLCGPPGMTASARTALRAAGVPARQIHTESFEF